jgi:hypothetical protein
LRPLLRLARLQSLLEVGTARLLAAMLGDLGVSTLHSIKTMTQLSSLFQHQTSHAACFNARGYSTSASSTPSYFLHRTNLLGNPFLITSLLDLPFSSLLPFWIIIPAILPATMLGYYSMSASSVPSNFFIIVSIYWKPASYRSSLDLPSFGKITNRSATKSTHSFGPTCVLFDLSVALRLRHDLSKVATPTPRSGACETWVPLGPHRPSSWSSPTSGFGLPEDPPTC